MIFGLVVVINTKVEINIDYNIVKIHSFYELYQH